MINLFPAKVRILTQTILIIAFPVMLQNMAFYLMTFINTAFLGHYDINTLTTVNNVMVPFNMLFMLLIALSQGTTVLIAQAIGAKDNVKASRIAESSLFYTQLISFVYFIFWFFWGKQVLILMGTSDIIVNQGTDYIKILSFMYLTMGLNITAGAIFQGIRNTVPIMINTIIRAMLNIFLDYLLIFGNFGFPEMGLTGAAVASLVSITICNVYIVIKAINNGVLHITIKGILNPVKGVYRSVFIFGSQAGLEFMLWTGAQVVLIRMLNVFNPMDAGLYGILNTLVMLSFNLYIGIGTASMTMIGHSCGARKYNEIIETGNMCVFYSIAICAVVSFLLFLNPVNAIKIFTKETAAIESLSQMIPIVILVIFPKSVNVIVGNAIRGTGDVRWMLYTQIAGTIIIIGISALFILHLRLGVLGLMYANFIDELWRAVVNYIKFFIKAKRFQKRTKMLHDEKNLVLQNV